MNILSRRVEFDKLLINGELTHSKEASRHNMHLVYPMLVIFDDKMTVYDDLIMGIISYIQTKYSAVQPTLTIPYTIFFLFFHVDNSRIIKTQVLQWINQKQQLMP